MDRAPVRLFLAAAILFVPASALGAAKLGETCDGIAAIQCEAPLWCQHEAGQCNVADASGVCVEQTEACTTKDLDSGPVCGCDKQTYSNDCIRRAKMVQVDHPGACKEGK